MKNNSIIYFISPIESSFIKIDRDILSSEFEVLENKFDWVTKAKTPLSLLKQFFFLLSNIKKLDAIVVSFGGYWSLLPSLFGRLFSVPCFIILHGTDCASIPSLNYGNLRGGLLKWAIKNSYARATKLLPVSESLINVENTYNNVKAEVKQGVKNHFPQLKINYETVFNGIDIDFWKNVNEKSRNPESFLTVFGQSQFELKGGDLIVELSRRNSDKKFKIVGYTPNKIRNYPPNLEFTGRVSQQELRDLYFETTYYFQLSVYEGFGCALCEAMLCGATPIVSSVNMLPEIVGDLGYVLNHRDISELDDLISKKLTISNPKLLHSKIVERFSLRQRNLKLLSQINAK